MADDHFQVLDLIIAGDVLFKSKLVSILPSFIFQSVFPLLLLCLPLSLPPCLLMYMLLEAFQWCPHNLFSLLNSFSAFWVYIIQLTRKWSTEAG